ncbi:hypothetical protein HPB49_020671 [Dermacentor silvarum]|uniref:Uncharacterized protein n=1 Tax=Dermacentor silvarum TaxID=543639 RepID=A0ACB8CHF0_DERSI|nr:hypothetical protein HPB49_020671 [Dermacentor silvarum]
MLIDLIQKQCGEERPKVDRFVERVVRRLDDTGFRKHFRVSRSVFYRLIADYENSSFYPKHHGGPHPQKSAEEHVLSFLWFAGNKTTERAVAVMFGMAESTVNGIIERVAGYLNSISANVMRFPDTPEKKKKRAASAKFEETWRIVISRDRASSLHTRAALRLHGSAVEVICAAISGVSSPVARSRNNRASLSKERDRKQRPMTKRVNPSCFSGDKCAGSLGTRSTMSYPVGVVSTRLVALDATLLSILTSRYPSRRLDNRRFSNALARSTTLFRERILALGMAAMTPEETGGSPVCPKKKRL